jgi:hypothetical protein
MNPLELESKRGANRTQGLNADILAPKAAVARANVANPDWLKGELASQALEGQAKDSKSRKEATENQEDAVVSAMTQAMAGLQSGQGALAVIPAFENLDPKVKQILTRALYSDDPHGNLRFMFDRIMEARAERGYAKDKLQTESKNQNAIDVANINAASRVAAASKRGSGTDMAKLTDTQLFTLWLRESVERGDITQAQANQQLADYTNAKNAAKVKEGEVGVSMEGGKASVVPRSPVTVSPIPTNKEEVTPKPAAPAKRRVWDSKANKWVEQ